MAVENTQEDKSYSAYSALNEWPYTLDYWNSNPDQYANYGELPSREISPRHPVMMVNEKGSFRKSSGTDKILFAALLAILVYTLGTA